MAGGYQNIDFDNTGLVNDSHDLDDYYFNALLSHRVNSVLTHNLSVGHETQLGVNSNYVKLNYARHTATWNIFYHTLLSTELFYEDAEESGGLGPLVAVPGSRTIRSPRSTFTATAAPPRSPPATPHVTLGLRYQYTQDRTAPDYRQNRIAFDGTYSF